MQRQGLWKRVHSHVWTALFCLTTATVTAFGQTGAGSVAGTVRDAEQRVIPGAGVTITEIETNVSRSSRTSDVGVYYFGALPRGPYRLSVEKEGFKKWEGTLTLQVGQNAVIDVGLEVGDVKTVVEVTGVAPVITTSSAEVSDVKDYARIRQLPLNGRQISQLFALTPGVEPGTANDTGSPRVNGLKVGSLDITLDGISILDRFGGGMARVQPGLETVQEFRIETVGSDARSSRPANVTLSTRSGTNAFHGSAYEFHRNNSGGLRARRREDAPDPDTKKFSPAQLIRNEYGVTAGGPFIIPGLYDGRNKSFWFAAFEGSRTREQFFSCTFGDNFCLVPTEAMWNGDLSNSTDPDGTPWIIYDPLTTDANGLRQPFPNNIIPPERISPFGRRMAELTARPTNENNPWELNGNNVRFYPRRGKTWNLTLKGDQHFSDKDALSVRFTRSTRNNTTDGGVFGNPVDVSAGLGTSRGDTWIHNVQAVYNRSLSNNVLNELQVGVHRSYNSSGTLADFTDWANDLGVPNPFGVTGWPTIYSSLQGLYYWGYFGWDSDNRHDQALTAEVVEDHVSWIKGNHNIQFGGRARMEQNNVRELQQAQGSHDWDGSWTAQYDPESNWFVYGTGSGFADFLLGLPSYLSNQYNRGYFYFRQTELGLYVSDKWKVTPRLTLTMGVRWDKWRPYHEKFDRLAYIDPSTVATRFEVVTPGDTRMEDLPGVPPAVLDSWAARGLTWTTANEIGYPSNLFAADNNNLAPRLGAAFKIDNKTVLRGGYGEYFWPMPLSQILQSSRNNPPLNLRFENAINAKDDTFTYAMHTLPGSNEFIPNVGVDTEGIVELPSSARLATLTDGRNWKDGRSQTWNVTLEREMWSGTAVRLSYIGTHGRDLEQQFEINNREAELNYELRTGLAPPANRDLLRPNKDWTFNAINRTGFSNTHSAQIEIERRFANGLGFQWYYTFTRSLSTSDAGGFTAGNFAINSTAQGGRVPEVNQLWGAKNLSYDERLRLVYYNSTEVPPHRMRYNFIYDLPFGRGKPFARDISGALNHVVGGWQIAGIGLWRGGFWQSVAGNRYQFGSVRLPSVARPEMDIFGSHQRMWFTGDFNPAAASNVTGGVLPASNPAYRVVRQVGPDCSGNYTNRLCVELADSSLRNTPIGDLYNYSPRGNFLGPGEWNVDLSIFKNFSINERANIRFTADFFNAFNHPNDIDPNSVTGLQNLDFQRNDARIIQFSLRVDW
jgi:hypothetical protein